MVAFSKKLRYLIFPNMDQSLLHIIPLFIIIGTVAGFLSGLLGIGGGVLLVPLFFWSFKILGFGGLSFHIAIATSLSVVMWAAISGGITHERNRWVDRFALPYLAVGGLVGVFIGSTLASILSGQILQVLFSGLLCLVGVKLLFGNSREIIDKPISKPKPLLLFIGLICGTISSFFGMGGGVVLVPILLLIHYPIHFAIGTSTANVALIATFGTIAYLIHGLGIVGRPELCFGYIYWPATVLASIPALLLARLGAKTAHRTHTDILRKIFGAVMILVAAKVAYSAL